LWDLGLGLWEGKSLRERAHREGFVSFCVARHTSFKNSGLFSGR
jgi:hypothetical protein